MGIFRFSIQCSVLALALCSSANALAQMTTPAPVQPVPNPNDPAVMLKMHLKVLSQSPNNVDALTNAGSASLVVGDPNAALGFLARAEQLSPLNGRVKALLGTTLTMMEKPDDALRYFNEAAGLGIPDYAMGKDRGLAFDLKGDPKRAQKDYLAALRYSADPELIRRLAMSLGITGDKDDALERLAPLIKKNDQAAWRARAFVHAMNGEQAEASRIVRQVTPPSMTGSMDGFMRRLAVLNPAQRAAAVNFGTMPSSGPSYAALETGEGFKAISSENASILDAKPAAPKPAVAAPVRVARRDTQPTVESERDVRQREKRERELEKLAERARREERRSNRGRDTQVAVLTPPKVSPTFTPRPSAPTLAAPQPQVVKPPVAQMPEPVAPKVDRPPADDGLPKRVGQRIGPVDQNQLPPELRPFTPRPVQGADPATQPVQTAPAAKPPEPRVTVLPNQRALPEPEGVRPPAPLNLPPEPKPVEPKPVQIATSPTLPPVVPPLSAAPQPPKIDVVPPQAAPNPTPVVASTDAALLPPAPKPESVAVKPPETVSTVAPTPVTLPKAPDPVVEPKPTMVATVSPPTVPTPAPTQSAPSALPSVATPTVTPAPTMAAPAATTPPVTAPTPVVAPPLETPRPGFTPAPPTQIAAVDLPASGLVPPPEDVAPPTASDVAPPASATDVPPIAAAEPAKPADEPGLGAVISGLELEDESSAAPVLTDAQMRAKRLAEEKKEAAERLAKEKAEKETADKAKADKAKVDLALKEKSEKEAAAKLNPARTWVQVATGANRGGLPITWRRIKEGAPKSLAKYSPSYAPVRATYRLVVGPVKSSAEARTLVAALSKEGVSATIWQSDAGQEVSKLGAR
jgi:tetratricopeptide (TPR) repeat protein